jgi:hypothetical protein
MDKKIYKTISDIGGNKIIKFCTTINDTSGIHLQNNDIN